MVKVTLWNSLPKVSSPEDSVSFAASSSTGSSVRFPAADSSSTNWSKSGKISSILGSSLSINVKYEVLCLFLVLSHPGLSVGVGERRGNYPGPSTRLTPRSVVLKLFSYVAHLLNELRSCGPVVAKQMSLPYRPFSFNAKICQNFTTFCLV